MSIAELALSFSQFARFADVVKTKRLRIKIRSQCAARPPCSPPHALSADGAESGGKACSRKGVCEGWEITRMGRSVDRALKRATRRLRMQEESAGQLSAEIPARPLTRDYLQTNSFEGRPIQ